MLQPAARHGFRHVCPEAVRAQQVEVLRGDNAMFLLHQSGPTGFVIQEQKRRRPVKVHLGDRHTCSCTNFTMNSDLCLHLCWTLLKKLKFQPEDPRSFQLGLASHDLAEHLAEEKPAAASASASAAAIRRRDAKRRSDEEPGDGGLVRRRGVGASDTCPICLEELLEKRAPVSHCRHGCGNAVHLGCMRVVAHHQLLDVATERRPTHMLTCPLCRGDFCTAAQLVVEARNAPNAQPPAQGGKVRAPRKAAVAAPAPAHVNVSCACCAVSPVVGVLYRCATCPDVRMCAACAASPRSSRLHRAHGLVAKKRPGDGWQRVVQQEAPAQRAKPARPRRAACGVVTLAALAAPDADGDADADAGQVTSAVAEDVRTTHIREGSKLLLPGQQCLLCLAPFKMKQAVGRLPCGHHFHARCLCEWLRTSASCPLDGTAVRSKQPRPGLAAAASDPAASGRTSPSPASLCVRRLDLADRRDASPTARSASPPPPRPGYLLDGNVWTDADHVASSRHAALPARPLGGQQRLLGGHPRRLPRGKPADDPGGRSPTHLSVRSLALPDGAGVGVGVGVAAPRRTSAKDGRRRGAKVAELTSERMRGLDFLAESDFGDLVDVKCLRMRLAERRLPK